MKKVIVILFGLLLALLAGCNVAKDTAATGEKGTAGATGIAEKMKGGTVGDTDEDSAEPAAGDEGGE